MATRKRIIVRFFSVLAIGCFAVLGGRAALAASICSEGVGVPPFLSQGEDPNVLMIIDNSASMYDLAYIPDPAAAVNQGYCFDNTYNNAATSTYAGYFEQGSWYKYNLVTGRFEITTTAAADCTAAVGTKYDRADLCVKIDETVTPLAIVNYFAATGKLLNWAAASKFDVEKKVLTGGKYDAANQLLLLMESRGCQDKVFIKQVTVMKGADPDPYYLTLGIRKIKDEDDGTASSSSLTGIEIYKPTERPYNFGDCQAAADEFITPGPVSGQFQNLARQCVSPNAPGFVNQWPSQVAFIHQIHQCWKLRNEGDLQSNADVPMRSACATVYNISGTGDGFNDPNPDDETYQTTWAPNVQNSSDPCYGKYGTNIGYVGRCWENYYTTAVTQVEHTCDPASETPVRTFTNANTDAHTVSRYCASDASTAHARRWIICNGTYKTNGKCTPGSWTVEMIDDPTGDPELDKVGWTNDVNGTFLESGLFADDDDCIKQSMKKFCAQTDIQLSIDPSDALSSTTETFNIPAFLAEGALLNQYGSPLLTMMGKVLAAATPSGILQTYANDIRFGTMAFHKGAKTECKPVLTPAACPATNPGCTQTYVASLANCLADTGTSINVNSVVAGDQKDGAHIVTYIGKSANHFKALTQGINDIPADAWTPTAEAYSEAIGYYTQKSELRINATLPISTSTYDYFVNSTDAASFGDWQKSTHYAASPTNPKYVRDPSNNKIYVTFDEGDSSELQADGITTATGPSNDTSTSLTWLPIDPVLNYCQSNNVLILTDGASTADQRGSLSLPAVPSANVVDLAVTNGDPATAAIPRETTTTNTYACGALMGSTLLDDLAYYGFNGSIYPLSKTWINEETGLTVTGKNIQSFIVSTGTPREVAASLPAECNSLTQLGKAATNGGSTLLLAENPEKLAAALKKIFDAIKAGTSSGSASSVISASRGGEGAIYQAIFWPKQTSIDDPIQWIGDVHALLIDSYGGMYEDDGYVYGLLPRSYTKRQLSNSSAAGERYTNTKVTLFFDKSPGVNQAMACNGTLAVDNKGTADTRDDVQVCNGIKKELKKVHYLWSAADWLASITAADIKSNRTTYISMEKKRYVYTWIDLNSDGAVDAATEWLPFTEAENLAAKAKSPATRGPVSLDFGVAPMPADNIDVNDIVNWVRGYDFVAPSEHTPIPLGDPVPAGKYPTRSRQRNYSFDPDWDWATTPSAITWRMSDVIHSTPTAVTRPSEGYHLLYKDLSYAGFIDKYNKRRHMIYFGSNGGMLHAVNGGFYDDVNKRFCRTVDCSNEGDPQGAALPNGSPELGAEMWAYVPYNLLPHLKCLMERDYTDHKYYVDLRPRVFDVRLWSPMDVGTHYNGWGTIMVVGMRFGGSPVEADELDLDGNGADDYPLDNRKFASSYIVFDITDPEQPPVLLGELNHTSDNLYASMGYSTVMPTVVPMKLGNAISDWYLILGSGPTEIDGTSDQPAKLAVYDLKKLISPPAPFRINNDLPTVLNNQNGRWELTDPKSFISDLITVDFELNTDYMADAVYFGTVSGDWGNWGGKMYRLVTRKMNVVTNNQEKIEPSLWGGLLATNPKLLFNAGRPVTAAAAVGTDYTNHWVYFGTGRFFDRNDKSDNSSNALESYYGIKEPKDCSGAFTWEEVEKNAGVGPAGPGSLGLRNVTKVRVLNSSPASSATLFCDPNLLDTSCLPAGVTTFDKLIKDIAGKGRLCAAGSVYGTDGWYRELTTSRERNLGQATLLGGLLTFTTYQPFLNLCLPEGLGYLYGLYFQTGTPWHKAVFSNQAINTSVEFKIDMGRGLSTTPNIHIGKEEGGKAFAQTSTGAIVEIEQPNLPFANVKTGREDWRQIKPAIR